MNVAVYSLNRVYCSAAQVSWPKSAKSLRRLPLPLWRLRVMTFGEGPPKLHNVTINLYLEETEMIPIRDEGAAHA